MPNGRDGFVAEDLDLLVRWFGPNFHFDARGGFMLVELKYGNAWIGGAQKMTFGVLDELLRKGDPEGQRYTGFYLVQYDNEDWECARFKINGVSVTQEQMVQFWSHQYPVLPFKF